MTRLFMGLVLALGLSGMMACALTMVAPNDLPVADPAAVTAAQAILDTVKPGDFATYTAAETQLATAVSTTVLNVLYGDENAALVKVRTDPTKMGETARLMARVDVLDAAMIRQSWKLNPQQLMTDWLAKLPYTWTGRGARITDLQVTGAFPDHLFYVVKVFNQNETLLPILNIFAIGRDGTVTHLQDAKTLEAFFLAKLPPALQPVLYEKMKADTLGGLRGFGGNNQPMRNAVYSWLRLSSEFAPGIQLVINEKGIQVETMMTATIGAKPTTVAHGSATPAPGTGYTGNITVYLHFNDEGKLGGVTEQRTLQAPPPPIMHGLPL